MISKLRTKDVALFVVRDRPSVHAGMLLPMRAKAINPDSVKRKRRHDSPRHQSRTNQDTTKKSRSIEARLRVWNPTGTLTGKDAVAVSLKKPSRAENNSTSGEISPVRSLRDRTTGRSGARMWRATTQKARIGIGTKS